MRIPFSFFSVFSGHHSPLRPCHPRVVQAITLKSTDPMLSVMNITRSIALFGVIALSAFNAHADDVAGQWRAEFDTQIGVQKYLFTFQTDGEKLTGKAAGEVEGRKRETNLTEGKIAGDTLSFVEMLDFEGNILRIHYTGKV